jgi:hypothetical protein
MISLFGESTSNRGASEVHEIGLSLGRALKPNNRSSGTVWKSSLVCDGDNINGACELPRQICARQLHYYDVKVGLYILRWARFNSCAKGMCRDLMPSGRKIRPISQCCRLFRNSERACYEPSQRTHECSKELILSILY